MHTPVKLLSTFLLSLLWFIPANGNSHSCGGPEHIHSSNCSPTHTSDLVPSVSTDAHKQTSAFIQNKNQWHPNVKYRTSIPGRFNNVFLEENRITYQIYDDSVIEDFHRFVDDKETVNIKGHSYHVNFVNSNAARIVAHDILPYRHNYFVGKDQSKWASNVPLATQVVYEELYDKIDLRFLKNYDDFKYEFILNPGADVNDILLEYEGVDDIQIDNNKLKITSSVGIMTELQPYTYQIIEGKKVEIACEYRLVNNRLSFFLPNGYDRDQPLVIDPIVIAATLSGHNVIGSAGVFGHTAAFDSEGNIYTGGRVYGNGYLVTTGAFDADFNGGAYDMGFSKYNPTGTQQVYATYVGGASSDNPHSIITDFSQRLYVYGSSNSDDFPTTSSAFQSVSGGLTDIVVFVLSTDGSALVGSSFIGGSENDGLNESNVNDCYGGEFRGEIVIDFQNNIYIASGTRSPNFPVFNGFDESYNSGQDGVVFKMSSDLSAMYWSTFLGSINSDFCSALRIDDFNNVYVTGTAGAPDFPTTPGVVMPNYPGGDQSAFVAKINSSGDELELSTFWGTEEEDRGFFLDIDEGGDIHIYGISTGTMPITAGTYFNEAGSPQFITGFTSDLDLTLYSTVIGTGPGGDGFDFESCEVDFVPVAFMVDKCDAIYFSGYSAANNLPLTTGNFWSNGDSFYLGVLNGDATDLTFATYYGRSNHVDGGTSRFDKSGTVYQAVCSCTNGGNNAMVTNSDAFETNMPLNTCDVGVFKIDFEVETVTAGGVIFEAGTNVVSASGCAPYAVDFLYTGADAESFYWNFGDGGESFEENPSHLYQNPGTYPVFLVAESALTCNQFDTVFLQVDVIDDTPNSRDTSFCAGATLFLDASVQNATYSWQDGFTGSTYVVTAPGIYWVDVDIGNCARRDSFIVNPFLNLNVDIGPDVISACDVLTYTFDGTIAGADSYLWQNGEETPQLTTMTEGIYSLTVTDANGCEYQDEAQLLFGETPSVNLGSDVTLCDGVEFTANVSFPNPNVSYTWSDGTVGPDFSTTTAGTYTVVLSDDGCEATDEVVVAYYPAFDFNPEIVPIACSSDCNASIELAPTGGEGNYVLEWNTGSDEAALFDLCPGLYTITATDEADCEYTAEYDLINPDILTFTGDWQDLRCAGDSSGVISAIDITGGVPPYSFSLNNEAYTDTPSFEGLDAGTYTLNLLDNVNCLVSTEIVVTEPPEFFVEAGEDQVIELGETTELNGAVFPLFGQTIEWSPAIYLDCTDCLDPGLQPANTTTYTLTATDPDTGCEREDDVTVEVLKVRKVYIPNVFSPDFDGVNDEFRIFAHIGVSEILEFKIFDRWGGLVFENANFLPNKPGFGWNGTVNGQMVNPAVFAYYARVRYLDGEIGLFKGDVTVLR